MTRALPAVALVLLALPAACAVAPKLSTATRCPPGEHRVEDPGEPVRARCRP